MSDYWQAKFVQATVRAVAAEAHVCELGATIAAVEALADDWMRNEDQSADYQDGLADAAEQVRAALRGES